MFGTFFITHGYLEKHLDESACRYIESEAANLLTAMSCYFAEPHSNKCYLDRSVLEAIVLWKETICGSQISDNMFVEQFGFDCFDPGFDIKLTVYDDMDKCPKGNAFIASMEKSASDGWTNIENKKHRYVYHEIE